MDNKKKGWVTFCAFLWAALPTSTLLWLAKVSWAHAPGITAGKEVDESKWMAMVLILGAIGGFVRWMHFLKTIVFDTEKIWQWIIDSVLTPLMGAALALLCCIAFRAALTVQSAGQNATGNIN